jgi:hypothetical protein
MSDPRTTPNARYGTGDRLAQIGVSKTDLCRNPGGPRDRQLIYGDALRVFGAQQDWLYVQSQKDGYCGFIREKTIVEPDAPTHFVCAPATHVYKDADLKSPEITQLSFGSRITCQAKEGAYVRESLGYIPHQHLRRTDDLFKDPGEVAALFLGTPYLWGGNSRDGIDCSGLVQSALLACGIPCPGDSDMQMALGRDATSGYQCNDLLFWKGHVALVSDPETIIHANAGAMATVYEPITDAITRIEKQGGGPVTAHRRLAPLSGHINSPPEA